jgi:hypothetical protein
MSTVSLQMIVKDEAEEVGVLIGNAVDYFDAVNVTISDKKTYDKFKKVAKGIKKINIQYRKWTNDFGEARNDNLKLCNTDFFFWVDADDSFDFSRVPSLVERAEREKVDAIYLPYDYAHDDVGNCIARHSRERLVRTGTFEWRGEIHETLIPITGQPNVLVLPNPVVVHNKSEKGIKDSQNRNHEYLVRLANETLPDPRNVYYYGLSLFGKGLYESAIIQFQRYIPMSGWDEEIYRAVCKISESHGMLDNYDTAMEFALKASALMPHYPDAYYLLAQYEYEAGNQENCLEWLKTVFKKPPVETLSVHDPTAPLRALVIGAQAEYELGNYSAALGLLDKAIEGGVPLDLDKLHGMISWEAAKEVFIKEARDIQPFVDPKQFYECLRPEIKTDVRMRWLKEQVVPPRVWKQGTIVFFCGKGYEEWGAHTLDKGMGGSEEAVVYLSREFVRQGYNVVVYGEVPDITYDPVEVDDDRYVAVTYLPWQEFDKRDTFNTLVLWRTPEAVPHTKAVRKIVDMHDLLPPERVTDYGDATYFFKTNFHREKYPQIPDERAVVIGNGIVRDQFSQIVKRRDTKSVGYFSAYYRGLEMLLLMWPKIKERVPEATLDIYYGWQSWIAMEGENDFYKRVTKMLEHAKQFDVTEHGRVSHTELAEAMSNTKVWAYPTEFEEVHCITALKTQTAGCTPVVTAAGALPETVLYGNIVESKKIYEDQFKQGKFIDAVVEALESDEVGGGFDESWTWESVAKQWLGHINDKA